MPMPFKLKFMTCALIGAVVLTSAMVANGRAEDAVVIPAPAVLETSANTQPLETAVLAGGCFWGVQAVFQHVKGVENVVSGYAGGDAGSAQYEVVGTGQTGHAESVEIKFNPKLVNYGTILQVYFSVAHNPTQLNFQGPDQGTQYRSAIFPQSEDQQKVAKAYIEQLGKAGVFSEPIVTTIEPGKSFYPAEDYHQDYATLHPDNPYIAINDLPKVENLGQLFPELYSATAKLVKG